jgi:hypothetical protein
MEDPHMSRKLVKTTELDIDGRDYALTFYEQETARGSKRFSCEVALDAGDRIILDDDSMAGLEWKLSRLGPATVYSRVLAARKPVAA